MEKTLSSHLSQLLEDGLTKYEILPFIVILSLLIFITFYPRKLH